MFKCSGCIILCPDNSFIYNNKTPVCLQQQLNVILDPQMVSYDTNIMVPFDNINNKKKNKCIENLFCIYSHIVVKFS